MNNNNRKAIVATVRLGNTELEGLMLPDGSYCMGVSQIPKILPNSVRPNQASRTLKRNLGEDFQFDQCTSELNPKPVNTITLDQVEQVIEWAAFENNDKDAQSLIKALIKEGLERRFDVAFDKRRSEESYNQRLAQRMQGKQARWDLTDSIQAYIDRHKITGNKAKFYYKHVTDKLYFGLTRIKSTKKVREKYDVPTKATIRDYCTDRDLLVISQVEALAQRWIDDYDMEPCKAIDDAVDRLYVRNIGLKRESRL